MNREQLEEIRKRAEKATKGPWRVVVDDSEKATTVCRECESDAHPLDEDPGRDYLYDDCLDGELHSEPFFREADAEFIAHARTDVPALLDELDRRDREHDRLWSMIARVHGVAEAAKAHGVSLDPAEVLAALEGDRAETRRATAIGAVRRLCRQSADPFAVEVLKAIDAALNGEPR